MKKITWAERKEPLYDADKLAEYLISCVPNPFILESILTVVDTEPEKFYDKLSELYTKMFPVKSRKFFGE
jgi:hypothetical protein